MSDGQYPAFEDYWEVVAEGNYCERALYSGDQLREMARLAFNLGQQSVEYTPAEFRGLADGVRDDMREGAQNA